MHDVYRHLFPSQAQGELFVLRNSRVHGRKVDVWKEAIAQNLSHHHIEINSIATINSPGRFKVLGKSVFDSR